MTTILQGNHNAPGQVLYMALELSNKKWKLVGWAELAKPNNSYEAFFLLGFISFSPTYIGWLCAYV